MDVSRVTMSVERSRRTSGTGERRMGENAGWGGVGVMWRGRTGTAGSAAGAVELDFSDGLVLEAGAVGVGARTGLKLRVGLGVLRPCWRSSPSSERIGRLGELRDARGMGGRGGEWGSSSSS